jgi:hypothetical protein
MVLFPMAFVDPIADAMERNLNSENEYTIIRRPISPSDPSRSICIFPTDWTTDPSQKMIGAPNREPFEQTYKIAIQNSLVSGDTEEGRAMFSVDAKAIRAILYRDQTFAVALTSQVEVFMNTTERVLKYDVLRQEYMASRMTVGFMYLAKTEFVITTEVTQ